MNFKKRESTLTVFLERQEAAAFLSDFIIVLEVGYVYTEVGEFVYSNLQESVRKQHGFEVTLSAVAVRDLLKDLNYKLNREMMVTRVTKNLIDNLTYFLMSDNQKVRFYENGHFHPGLYF
jgi:excinuclease UvrABC helicase subunit UvrB